MDSPPWSMANALAVQYAQDELNQFGLCAFALSGWRGDTPIARVVVRLRDGEIDNCLIEAGVAPAALGADRFHLAVTGMAWSPLDPIPPVTDDVDLRQPVFIMFAAYGGNVQSQLHVISDGRISPNPISPRDVPQDGRVNLVQLMRAMSLGPQFMRPATDEDRRQVLRAVQGCGHVVMLSEAAEALLKHGT